MPRGKKSNHDNPTVRVDGASAAPAAFRSDGVPSVPGVSTLLSRGETALEALHYLYATDVGWLRISPQESGKVVYYKFKFTRGKWHNHYVMYRDDELNPFTAIVELARKVSDVLHGERRPAQDHYYDA